MKQNLLLLLVTLILCFILSEVTLRILDPGVAKAPETPKSQWAALPERVWTEYHPALGWYHQRNKETRAAKDFFDVLITTNSQGFRGSKEYSYKKPQGKQRMLVLGDSFAFGFGVEDHDTFSAILEYRLSMEAINLGVAGYGLDQMLVAYREIGSKYEADYVLIAIYPEDFWRSTRSFSDGGYAKPYFVLAPSGELQLKNTPVPARYELKTHQFPEIIYYSAAESFMRKSYVYRLTKRAILKIGKDLGLVDPDTTVEWVIGKSILERLIEEIKANDSKPLFMIAPPKRWALVDENPSLRRSLTRFSKNENIPLIDMTTHLYEAIQESNVDKYYIKNDGHWSPQGHVLVANTIRNQLKEL